MGLLEVLSFAMLVLLIRQLFKLGGLLSKVGIGVFAFLYSISLVDGSYTGNDIMVFFLFLVLILLANRYLKSLREDNYSSLEDSEKIGTYEFNYQNNDGSISHRTVDVRRIHYSKRDNSGFFTGYCHEQKMERTFRMDRVTGKVIDQDTGEVLVLE
jgi:hypothetical protein